MKIQLSTINLLIILSLVGCTEYPAYSVGQAWHDNLCENIADSEERKRCISDAEKPYEDYKRQTDEATGK
ncbi:MAG: hypothetical protein ABL933_07320 [Methyloglobulus sp.]|nr:hypothetical protein [Methyloglobulus sp.]